MGTPTPKPSPVALTCGEPASIAPEITARAWLALRDNGAAPFFLIGDSDYFSSRASLAGIAIASMKISTPGEAHEVFPDGSADPAPAPGASIPDPGSLIRPRRGVSSPPSTRAHRLPWPAKRAALVTNPIQKEALYAAGFRHQGHTDYLAAIAGRQRTEVP